MVLLAVVWSWGGGREGGSDRPSPHVSFGFQPVWDPICGCRFLMFLFSKHGWILRTVFERGHYWGICEERQSYLECGVVVRVAVIAFHLGNIKSIFPMWSIFCFGNVCRKYLALCWS